MATMTGARARELVLLIVEEDIRQGLVQFDPALDDRALRRQLLDRVFPHFETVPPAIEPAAHNHEDELFARAKGFTANADEACFFYATWAEHFVNRLIVVFCRRSGSGAAEAERLIRLGSSTLKEKATSVLRAVNGEGLDPALVQDLQRVADYRNDFVHYKWKPISAQQEEARRRALARTDAVTAHLRSYEDRHVFRNQRNRIRDVLKDRQEGGDADWNALVAALNLVE